MDDSFNCFHLPTVIADIGSRLQLDAQRIQAAVELLDAGNTIPFIARYRKEATKSLDEVALRQIEDWLHFHQELAQRKNTILKTIDQQQQLTPELRQQIEQCWDKNALEEIYLPYKPKRRTRATIARERGLQPLADILLAQESLAEDRQRLLQRFVDPAKDVADAAAALAGACDIVAEVWSEDAAMRQWMFDESKHAMIRSQVKRGKKSEDSKFEMYFDHQEALRKIPSHRFLAMKRAEAEGVVNLNLQFDEAAVLRKLQHAWVKNPRFEFAAELRSTVEDCFRRLLLPSIESSVLSQLKETADAEAIEVFAKNLRELLLAAPAGPKVTMGIDPGFRTGCKVAVVDGTGKFLTNTTIYPTPPKSDIDGAEQTLLGLIQQYQIELIAIGNGTASRETDQFVSKLIKQHRLPVTKVMVNESGASIYSASELAVSEYPQLDVTVRGAISIAHRLQDPLAELVKIDAKSIGVGQYQHDVNQSALKKSLDREVESCVNSVGVDLNMASSALLSYVAGIGPKLAANIVRFRDENGRFQDRSQISKVPKLGNKAFVQAAGFLRIRDGRNPLDNSAVHPESYYVVEKMAKSLKTGSAQLVGNSSLATKLNPKDFIDEQVGEPTVKDILNELAKPGRDPRSEFKVATFKEGVNELSDVKEGMVLEGVVTNVTKFGAFVDIGVHQDGLVHISQLANAYISDPSEVVSVGDVIKVKVLEVDVDRKRISLSKKAVG